MKLITDVLYNTISLNESVEDGQKNLYIEGIFAQAVKKNRNGRVYPKNVLENAIDKYNNEFVINGKAMGELNHPNDFAVNPERVCILIKQLNWQNNDVIGKARVIEDAPMGQIVKALLKAGATLGVSTRGAGSLTNEADTDVVSDDYVIGAIDCVSNPSGLDCWVRGINEGVEVIVEEGIYKTKVLSNPSLITTRDELHKSLKHHNFTAIKSDLTKFLKELQ